jgi:hypothetical protein
VTRTPRQRMIADAQAILTRCNAALERLEQIRIGDPRSANGDPRHRSPRQQNPESTGVQVTHEPTVSPKSHECPKCGRACDCYPDSPGECSHDCPPAVSPIEAPPKMTQKHWENLVLLDARALTKEECASLREVADNVKAQASGQRVVVDPATQRVIDVKGLEALVQIAESGAALSTNQRLAGDFGIIARRLRRWLSHNSPEETQ